MKIECTDIPISWLELERYVLGESRMTDKVSHHLKECDACERTKSGIEKDAREMPALVLPVPSSAAPTRPWWRWTVLLVPAIALLMIWRGQHPETELQPPDSAGVKGDALSLKLVRERGGRLIAPTHHAVGDRFKVLVSCAPGLRWVDLIVSQDGILTGPLSTSLVDCGNNTPMPGAFTLQGGVATVCIQFASEKDQGGLRIKDDAVCIEVQPESP